MKYVRRLINIPLFFRSKEYFPSNVNPELLSLNLLHYLNLLIILSVQSPLIHDQIPSHDHNGRYTQESLMNALLKCVIDIHTHRALYSGLILDR